jgi:predicted Fe-Mo cluster-binding NifX family protein
LTAFAQNASSTGKKSSSEVESSAQKELTTIKKLSQGADVIITGKVSQRKSAWNESKTKIYTKTTLQVEEYLKGKNNGNLLEITSPGGEVGEIGEIYTHMPKFEENEEVLLFLKKSDKNEGYKVMNGEEGKISMRNDKKTKEKVIPSELQIEDLKSQIKTFIDEK